MDTPFHREDGVAVIEIDNPPVNALGITTRVGIVSGIERALAEPAVSSIVLIGAGRCFSAGADIREFSDGKAGQPPDLGVVIEHIERSPKPVVAAIHGTALGGGLELAMGCHYRVAAPDARVGLPEIRLGMHPGAGGTQRLPRCVGLEKALEMLLSGSPVRAEELRDTRLFDRIGDVRRSAIELAREVGARSGAHPRVRDWCIEHPDPATFFAAARAKLTTKRGGATAALNCVDSLEAAVQRPFDEGLSLERETCMKLALSPEAAALRHAFFAERAAAKCPGVGPDTRIRPIHRVAVVGAGSMGRGIAMVFLNAGLPVTLIDPQEQALRRAADMVRSVGERNVAKGRLSAAELQRQIALLQLAASCEAVAGCDLIVEAVFEDYGVKETVFREIDAVAKHGAILATNTSTLNLNRVAQWTRRPQDVIGMHFFNPAHVMKLLEVVRGDLTAPDVLGTVMQLAAKLGKTPVISGVCDGFIGNRMFEKYAAQAMQLLEEGVLPEQVDRAIETFGFAMGPFRVADLAGNDIVWAIRKRRAAEQGTPLRPNVGDRICELGRYGQKTGSGWYDYDPQTRQPQPSNVVHELLAQHMAERGLTRREVGDQEIVERLVYALADEGARILEEGVALRASDIDVVYISGYGFPAWRGGPMYYAETIRSRE